MRQQRFRVFVPFERAHPRDTRSIVIFRQKRKFWMLQFAKIIWASPNTLLGLTAGLLAVLSGGRGQIRAGCIEFYGGLLTWTLKRMPLTGGVLAMTLGHCVIGQTESGLAIAREHERIHVSQYERWGPFFLPAYLVASGWLWLTGRDCYRENPFEVEAYAKADPGVEIVSDDEPNGG
jgi:hypothetical protein